MQLSDIRKDLDNRRRKLTGDHSVPQDPEAAYEVQPQAADEDDAKDDNPSLELFDQSDDPQYGYDNQWQQPPQQDANANDIMNEEDEMGMFI